MHLDLKARKMSFIGTQQKCEACDKTVYPVDQLSADGTAYHKACFKCSHCKGTLKVVLLLFSFICLLLSFRLHYWFDLMHCEHISSFSKFWSLFQKSLPFFNAGSR